MVLGLRCIATGARPRQHPDAHRNGEQEPPAEASPAHCRQHGLRTLNAT
jgi:hypothetical protein